MKKIFFFLFFVSGLTAQINSDGDFQIWNREIVNVHFSKQWTLYSFAESRIGDDASKLYEAFLHAELDYKAASWIAFGPGYRQAIIRAPINSNHWEPIYIPLVSVMLFFKLRDWEFSDRNRVQYEVAKSIPYPWLYRNRFRIVPPWSFTPLCINPFIDNEIFIYQGHGFVEDRLCSGLLFWLHDNLSGQLYYMCRFQKPNHWIHQNVLNISLLLAY